jgi:transcriptional regulator with XRE-family HTH domain
LPQQRVGGWLGLTQAQLSRVENGPAVTDLTKLTAWAGSLGVPVSLLWFHLPAADEHLIVDRGAVADGGSAAGRSTTLPVRVTVDADGSMGCGRWW